MNLRATSILTAGLILSQGCSLIFVTTPPESLPKDPRQEVSCTSSVVAPVVDTVIGAYQGLRTGVAIAADDSDYQDYPISRPADVALGLGFAALFVGSAVYGYSSTSACSDLKDAASHRPVDPSIIPRPVPTAPPLACTVDTQCKGDRICEAGRCVAPPPPTPAPAPEPAPVVPASPAEPSPYDASSLPPAEP